MSEPMRGLLNRLGRFRPYCGSRLGPLAIVAHKSYELEPDGRPVTSEAIVPGLLPRMTQTSLDLTLAAAGQRLLMA